MPLQPIQKLSLVNCVPEAVQVINCVASDMHHATPEFSEFARPQSLRVPVLAFVEILESHTSLSV